jgi:hypothetical protein
MQFTWVAVLLLANLVFNASSRAGNKVDYFDHSGDAQSDRQGAFGGRETGSGEGRHGGAAVQGKVEEEREWTMREVRRLRRKGGKEN